MTPTGCTGAVLTGGAGRRMGRDKALLEVEGRPLAARVVDALERAGASPVVCIGGDLDALAAAGLAAVPDEHPGEGPLGGLVTALGTPGAGELVVVLATDLLRPASGAIRACIDALGPDDDLVVPIADGRVQWLHGVWRRRRAEPHLRAAFDGGERSVHRAVEGLRVATVDGIERARLADADRPEDLTPHVDRN